MRFVRIAMRSPAKYRFQNFFKSVVDTYIMYDTISRFGNEVATFYNIFAPATYLSFALQDPGDKLTLAKLVVKLITESKAVSIGLTNRQAYLKIIIPQALTAALPR